MKQVWFLQTPDLILRLRNISVTKTLVICDRVDLSRLRSICFAVRWIKATVQQQMVLTAALGSIRRCCRTLASSQRPDTHRLSNSHSSLPNTLASAHTPPTAPEHTKPSGVKEFFFLNFSFHFLTCFTMRSLLDLSNLLLSCNIIYFNTTGNKDNLSW